MLSLCKTTTGVFRICADPGRSIFFISGKYFPDIKKREASQPLSQIISLSEANT